MIEWALGIWLLHATVLAPGADAAAPTWQEYAGQQYPGYQVIQMAVTNTKAIHAVVRKSAPGSAMLVVLTHEPSTKRQPSLVVDKGLVLKSGQSLVLATTVALTRAAAASADAGPSTVKVPPLQQPELLQVDCSRSDTGIFLRARRALNVELLGVSLHGCPGPALVLQEGQQVKLQDVELSHNNLRLTGGEGGALLVWDTQQVHIQRLNCHHNKAAYMGGCLRTQRVAEVVVAASNFSRNLKDGGDNAGGGAAIAVEHATVLTVADSSFIRNWAFGIGSKGGGLLVDTAAVINLTRSNFTDCTATEQGGGAFAVNMGTINVQGCSFRGNGRVPPREALKGVVGSYDVPKTGAGLDLGNTSPVAMNASITGCWFEGNTALGGAGLSFSQSGNDTSHVYIANTTFFNNTGSRESGGLGVGASTQGVVHIEETRFMYNTGARGAAFSATNQQLTVTDTQFISNMAFREAGAVMTDAVRATSRGVDSHATFLRVVFANNSCSRKNGAVLIKDQIVFMEDVEFSGNKAVTEAGALTLAQLPRARLINTSFLGNTAAQGTGGMSVKSVANVTVTSARLQNNSGQEGGAMRLLSVPFADLSGLSLLNNTARHAGGAVAILRSGSVSISNSSFSNNTAAVGGALAADGSSVLLAAVTVSLNRALASNRPQDTPLPAQQASHVTSAVAFASVLYGPGAAGACLFQRAHVSMDACTFTSNVADTDGGAALLRQPLSLRAHATNFTHNVAQSGSGGALALRGFGQQATSTLADCSFHANQAQKGSGGALLLDSQLGPLTLRMESCNFTDGLAAAEGGAVAALGPSEVGLTECHAFNNTAGAGGGWVSCQGCSRLSTTSCTAVTNIASVGAGGAVYCRSCGAVGLSGDAYSGNRAAAGGAVAVQGAQDINMTQCTFSNNTAAAAARALAQPGVLSEDEQQSTVSLEGWQPEWQALCSLRSALQPTLDASCNTAGAGGAVCLHSAVAAVVADSRFTGNSADTGGALLMSAACSPSSQPDGTQSNSVLANRAQLLIPSSSNGSSGADAVEGAARSARAPQCSLVLSNMTALDNTADQAGGALYTSTAAALQLRSNKAAQLGEAQAQQQQQRLLSELAHDNAAVGGAYGPGAASAPTSFSLQPGLQQVDAAGTTAASTVGRRRLLLQLKELQAQQRLLAQGTLPELMQECPPLDTTVISPDRAEVDSYQTFTLPIYLLDAFGSLITKGPGSSWAIRLSHVKTLQPSAGPAAAGGRPPQPSDATSPGSAGGGGGGGGAEQQQVVGLVGATRGRLSSGYVKLDNMTLDAGPGSSVLLQVSGNVGQASTQQALKTELTLLVRPCLPGQSAVLSAPLPPTGTTSHDSSSWASSTCTQCPAPLFSFSAYAKPTEGHAAADGDTAAPPSSLTNGFRLSTGRAAGGACQACPFHGVCVGGMLVPSEGCYHPHPRSATIWVCPMTRACSRTPAARHELQAFQCEHRRVLDAEAIDAMPYAAAQCSTGYAGPLCSSCFRPGRNARRQLQSSRHSRLKFWQRFSSSDQQQQQQGQSANGVAAGTPLLSNSSSLGSSVGWQGSDSQTQDIQLEAYGKSSGHCRVCMHAALAWLLFLLCRLLDVVFVGLLAALWLLLGQLGASPAAAALQAMQDEWKQQQKVSPQQQQHAHAKALRAKKTSQRQTQTQVQPLQQQPQHAAAAAGQQLSSCFQAAAIAAAASPAVSAPTVGRAAGLHVTFSADCKDPIDDHVPGRDTGKAGAGSTLSTLSSQQPAGLMRQLSSKSVSSQASSQASVSTQLSGSFYSLVRPLSLSFSQALNQLRQDSSLHHMLLGASVLWQQGARRGSTSSSGQWDNSSSSVGAVVAIDGISSSEGDIVTQPSIGPPADAPTGLQATAAAAAPANTNRTALSAHVPGFSSPQLQPLGVSSSHQVVAAAAPPKPPAGPAAAADEVDVLHVERMAVVLLALKRLGELSLVVLDSWQLAAVVLSSDLLLNLSDGVAGALSGVLITQHTTWQWVPFDCLMGSGSRAAAAAVQTLVVVLLPFLYALLLLPIFRVSRSRAATVSTGAARQHDRRADDSGTSSQPPSGRDVQPPGVTTPTCVTLWTDASALLLAAFTYCSTFYLNALVGAFMCMELTRPPLLPGEVLLQGTAWVPDLQLTCWQGQHWVAVVPVLFIALPAVVIYLGTLLVLAWPQLPQQQLLDNDQCQAAAQQQQQTGQPQPQEVMWERQEQPLSQGLRGAAGGPDSQLEVPACQQQQQQQQQGRQPQGCLAQHLQPSAPCPMQPTKLHRHQHSQLTPQQSTVQQQAAQQAAIRLPGSLSGLATRISLRVVALQAALGRHGVSGSHCTSRVVWSEGRSWWWMAARELIKVAVVAGFWGCSMRAPRVQGLVLLLLLFVAAACCLQVQAAGSVAMERWQYGCHMWLVLLAWLVLLMVLPGVGSAALGGVLLGLLVGSALLVASALGRHGWHVLVAASQAPRQA